MNKQTVLFPTDGSERSEAVEEFIIQSFDSETVRVYLAHIVEGSPSDSISEVDAFTEDPSKIREKMEAQGQEIVDEAAGRLTQAGYEVETRVLVGHPGTKICELARDVNADQILMSRRGRGEVREMLLGSVSQYVLHHTHCPITIIPQS